MSEEDHEIDVDSDVPEVGGETTAGDNGQGGSLDKRAHHNELERRRRDHIKDSFHGLRDCIPSLRGEKLGSAKGYPSKTCNVSRAHILNKATEYIRQMQKRSSSREEEIDDLKEKNEILEEQVQALERAKSMGTVENVEELLMIVAERVKERQRQKLQFQKNNNSAQSNKTENGVGGKENGKTSDITSPIAAALLSSTNKPNGSAPNNGTSDNRTIKDNSSGLPNSINLLANNLKTAQTLLTALSKNLPPGSTLPANVKSLAAKVLASPIRPQGSVATAPVPRGIVTATTVPRGTVPVVHQQQTQPQTALTKQQITGNSVQSRPTVTTHPSAVSQSMATPTASVTIAPTGSNSNSSQPSSAPNVLSQKAARDLHAQLVALQHSAGTQQLSPELLAQVHSLLNLSSSLVYTADTGCEEGDGTAHLESDISATQATSLSTSPRSTGEPGMNVAVELAPVLSSPESGVSSNPGSKRPAVGGSTVSKRLKMLDS